MVQEKGVELGHSAEEGRFSVDTRTGDVGAAADGDGEGFEVAEERVEGEGGERGGVRPIPVSQFQRLEFRGFVAGQRIVGFGYEDSPSAAGFRDGNFMAVLVVVEDIAVGVVEAYAYGVEIGELGEIGKDAGDR